jgi:hypothetical protein
MVGSSFWASGWISGIGQLENELPFPDKIKASSPFSKLVARKWRWRFRRDRTVCAFSPQAALPATVFLQNRFPE